MNDIQLKCFIALSETLNYTKAAEKLYITQPALSRYIQSLENEIGFKLFMRSPKMVELTPAGESFAADIKKIAEDYNAALTHAMDAENGFAGEIKIGILSGLILESYASYFLDYATLHSNIKFVVVGGGMPDMEEQLHSGDLDIAILPIESISFFSDLKYISLMEKPLRLYYVPESAHLERGTTPGLADFKDSNVIIFPRRDTTTMRAFARMCMDVGFVPKFDTSMKRNPELSLAMAMMQLGNNIAIFHEDIFLGRGDTFCSIALPNLPVATIVFAWNSKNCAKHVEAFVSYVMSRMKQQ